MDSFYNEIHKKRLSGKFNGLVIDLFFIFLKIYPTVFFRTFHELWPYFVDYGLKKLSKQYQINDTIKEWPENVYLCNHHRRSANFIDLVLQFLPLRFMPNKTMLVISNFKKNLLSVPLSYNYYRGYSLQNKNSEEKYWSLVTLQANIISVFPDRDGSQFYGDTSMSFRKGLFAASIFTQKPIVDLTIVEPTEASDTLTIEFTLWTPPMRPPVPVSGSPSQYAAWRAANDDLITAFTNECELDFKRRLASIENQKDPKICTTFFETCPINETIQRSLEKNNRASKFKDFSI
jgi:hypothetical protein